MANRPTKSEAMRQFSFRMSRDAYNTMSEIAHARGVDLSAIFNWMIAQHLPILVQRERERERDIFEAAKSRIAEARSGAGASTREALLAVKAVQEEVTRLYETILKRFLDEEAGRAA